MIKFSKSNKKKITFLIDTLRGGGSENVCVTLANALAKLDWKVDLVCLNLKQADLVNKVFHKVNLINLNVSRFAFSFFPILKYLKSNKVKLVICFHYTFASQLVVQKFFMKDKFKIIARNNSSLTDIEKYIFSKDYINKFFFKIIKHLYPKVDFLISQCQDMKKDLVQNYNFDSKKIKIIFNPAKIHLKKKIFNKKIVRGNYILAVGRLSKEKRFDLAIKIFSKVHKYFPKIKLKIVGYGNEKKYLINIAKKYEVRRFVEFTGFKKNLEPYYKKAKLVILTSLFEGFPNVLVESITVGTPVVSFNCRTGPRELIQNNKNGFLVKNHDEKMLEKKIIEGLTIDWNENLIKSTAINYKKETVIKIYESFLKKIVN